MSARTTCKVHHNTSSPLSTKRTFCSLTASVLTNAATQRIIPPSTLQKIMWGVLHIGGAWAWARLASALSLLSALR
jgi:hypothetical protein